jgi:hypothetical protein
MGDTVRITQREHGGYGIALVPLGECPLCGRPIEAGQHVRLGRPLMPTEGVCHDQLTPKCRTW